MAGRGVGMNHRMLSLYGSDANRRWSEGYRTHEDELVRRAIAALPTSDSVMGRCYEAVMGYATITRRDLLEWIGVGLFGSVAACTLQRDEDVESQSGRLEDLNDVNDAGTDADAGQELVVLYDTYAQALYFDGSYGPKTGVIVVADMAAGIEKTYDFWHGHGGRLHRFVLTPTHFAELRRKKRVTLTTTLVDGHQHTLFVDPVDPRWRVPGAEPTTIPI